MTQEEATLKYPNRPCTTMARKPRGRRRRPVQKLVYSASLALLTTGSNSVVAVALSDTVDDSVYAISMDARLAIRNLTPGEGPIVVGVAHGDYTAAEIEECLEAVASWDRGDKIAQEQAGRKVRTVGVFAGALAEESLNQGMPIRTRLGFMLEPGTTLDWWAWNKSGAALTTGGVVEANGQVWARRT